VKKTTWAQTLRSTSTSIMDSKSTTYITAAAVTIAAGLAVYAVYFDYKRRNDVDFRKKLSMSFTNNTVA